MIRKANLEDAEAIAKIYNHYVLNTRLTFEEQEVSVSEIRERISTVIQTHAWLVFDSGGEIYGYAYAGMWKTRTAYRYTAETSIYLHKDHVSKGIGKALYKELISQMKEMGYKNLIGGVAYPNKPSENLHESFGFVKKAHFDSLGYKFDKWIDVVYYQLIL